ncbi:MAG: biotin/lipoyl-containing protein, partial [Flavobacteriales bacterium]
MAKVELIMPKMGESVAEATITNWLKAEGDMIEMDETVLEIATDKVDSEVPSPVSGILVKTLFNVDDVVEVGQAIAIIETEGEDSGDSVETESVSEGIEEKIEEVAVSVSVSSDSKIETDKFLSPLVKSIVAKENISAQELESIAGSGMNERITKHDILSFVEQRGAAPKTSSAKPAKAAPAAA